jgi:hypothetical protein
MRYLKLYLVLSRRLLLRGGSTKLNYRSSVILEKINDFARIQPTKNKSFTPV